MSSFTAPLILESVDAEHRGRGLFLVHVAFSYDIGFKGSRDTVTVPKGFDTDLASIPWFARPFIPLSGRVAKPALVHDYLLRIGDKRAHSVFDEALKVAGVRDTTRWAMVSAVRLNSWFKRLLGISQQRPLLLRA
jgi:hypothetical protein